MNSKPLILCTLVAVALCLVHFGTAVPAIGHFTHKRFGVCLNNCVQCKTMLGDYFQGQTCALSCLKFKGKAIPDCEDIASIAPFLNALE
ncbi:hypothetical protein KR009_002559 [Drosophila setifemur]|nr:hypothetical protein KR009_002559 [Drosophila setifemur]